MPAVSVCLPGLVQGAYEAPLAQVQLLVLDDVEVGRDRPGAVSLLRDRDRQAFARIFDAAPAAVELVLIGGLEIKPEGLLCREVLP